MAENDDLLRPNGNLTEEPFKFDTMNYLCGVKNQPPALSSIPAPPNPSFTQRRGINASPTCPHLLCTQKLQIMKVASDGNLTTVNTKANSSRELSWEGALSYEVTISIVQIGGYQIHVQMKHDNLKFFTLGGLSPSLGN